MMDIYGFTLAGIYNYYEKVAEAGEGTTLFNEVSLYPGGTVYSNDHEEGYVIPAMNKQDLIDEIMNMSGELLTVPQNPIRFKRMLKQFFDTNMHSFERIWIALWMDYSPIDNYDRHEYHDNEYNSKMTNTDTTLKKEKTTFKPTGTETVTQTPTGSDTVTNSGTTHEITENYVYADNSSSASPDTKTDRTLPTETQTTTHSNDRHDTQTTQWSDDRVDTTETERYVDEGDIQDAHSGNDYLTIWAHGNIGVAKTSEIITDEIKLREFNFYTYVAEKFEEKLLLQIY